LSTTYYLYFIYFYILLILIQIKVDLVVISENDIVAERFQVTYRHLNNSYLIPNPWWGLQLKPPRLLISQYFIQNNAVLRLVYNKINSYLRNRSDLSFFVTEIVYELSQFKKFYNVQLIKSALPKLQINDVCPFDLWEEVIVFFKQGILNCISSIVGHDYNYNNNSSSSSSFNTTNTTSSNTITVTRNRKRKIVTDL